MDRLKKRLEESIEKRLQTERRKDTEIAPIGKVTILFTDVENSTALWEKFPKSMTIALRLHNSLFRGCMEQHNVQFTSFLLCKGYEVKTEGDAFMVAFSEGKDAVLFAISIQESLMDIDWPQDILDSPYASEERDPETGYILHRGLKVRVVRTKLNISFLSIEGIHCGVPLCQNDPITGRMDYFGQMVNKASRISASAAPGQILRN